MRYFYFIIFAFVFSFFACTDSVEEVNQPKEPSPKIEKQSLRDLVDTSIFETFEYEDGDTSYLMKKYYICFLKTGNNRSQSKEEAAKIQEAHLAHMAQLAKDKKICIAGPFDDEGEIRGIVIYSAKSLEEAESFTQNDPAVKAGRLSVEIHPWWAAVGSTLY